MKKITALILILALSLCMFGCKNKNSEITDPAVIKENQTLKIHCYPHSTLNPLENDNETNMQMLRLMFESLVQCDNSQKAQYLLASSHSISDDGLNWTIDLKKGVKWHDGTDFTADDVLYTYNYVLENAETSPYSVNVSNIESVSKTSDLQVVFKLKTHQANFINLLEIPIIKSGDFKPVGTGPFIYKETKNKTIYLASNDKWHGGDVAVKDINVKILPDKETATYAYDSKEIDIVSVTSGNDMGSYASNSDNVIVAYPSNTLTFLGINLNSEPLSNRLFRKAIAHSINKAEINSEVLLSHGSVANTCINSSWWMYNPGATIYDYNKGKAINTLNDVKKSMKLTPVTLMVNMENNDRVKVAEMIKSDLAETGIELNIQYVDYATFTERIASGNYQMYLGAVKYSAEVNPQYVIQNPSTGLQKLFVDLQTQTTEDGIKKKYYEIQQNIATDIHIIPLYFDANTVLYNKRITGNLNPCRINIFNEIQNLSLTL